MRYGYWLPVFGGWLRNVPDEGMSATWDYVKRLAQRSEQIGYDITLIAELFMNDIKGIDADSLEAWSTAAALAAVTEKLELMVAVRPTFHEPAIFAKQAANIDHISGRPALAQRRLVVVEGRSEAVRDPLRGARRSLRPHRRMAEDRGRDVERAALQPRRKSLQGRGDDPRAQADAESSPHDLRRW